jgi:hypothetical protein
MTVWQVMRLPLEAGTWLGIRGGQSGGVVEPIMLGDRLGPQTPDTLLGGSRQIRSWRLPVLVVFAEAGEYPGIGTSSVA